MARFGMDYKDRLKRTYKRIMKRLRRDLRNTKKKRGKQVEYKVQEIKNSIRAMENEMRGLDRRDVFGDSMRQVGISVTT